MTAPELNSPAPPAFNLIRATFADRDLEQRYRVWALDGSRRQALTAIVVASAFVLLFGFADVTFFGLETRALALIGLRVVTALAGVAGVVALRRQISVPRFEAILHAWTLLIALTTVVFTASRPAGNLLPVLTVAVVVIAIHVFIPTLSLPGTVMSVGMTLLYLAWNALRPGASIFPLVPMTIALALANSIGIVVGRWQHRVRRLQFAEIISEQTIAARLRDELEARARIERALAVAKEQAEEASRAKSLFLAVMSHELRTPLHSLMTATELLASTELSAPQREYLELMRYSGRGIMQLVDEVLELSRVEARDLHLSRAPFSPRALIEELARFVRWRVAARGLTLRTRLDGVLPPALLGDATRLRQVLLNLIENAIKYSDAGEIELTARPGEASAPPGRASLSISVGDRGPGVPESARETIFEPFVQLELPGGPRGGIGLGLAICQRTIRAMGGTITVEPRSGGGSLFTIVVELDEAPAAPEVETVPASEPQGVTTSAFNLLLVDDDETSRTVGAAMLERLGHRVTPASSGEEALEQLRRASFDAVLLDVRMPGLDGPSVVARVRALPPPARAAIPIVATTANVQLEERARYLAAGFDRVLAKPLDFREVVKVLGELISAAETPPSAVNPATPPGQGAEADAPWLDLSLLSRHADALGPAWVDDLLSRLLTTLPGLLSALEDAHHRGDRSVVGALAHRLTSAADTTGLRRLALAAGRIDLAVKREESDLDALIETLLLVGTESQRQVRQHLAGPRAASVGS